MNSGAWLATEWAGEKLWLSHKRALWWPRGQTLLIADPHFGKAALFRRAGIGIPAGTTEADLDRLANLIAETGAQRLVVLGDFFHAAPAGDEPWLEAFARFRGRHRAVAIDVIAGNHDRRARPPAAWHLAWHTEPQVLGPFTAVHEPEAGSKDRVIGGHLHPMVAMRGGGDRLRLPVFWLQSGRVVLPAFGGFTGGLTIRPHPGDLLFATGPDAVVSLPPVG